MKKIIFIALVMLALSTSFAQPKCQKGTNKDNHQGMHKKDNKLMGQLNLSTEQKSKLKEIKEEFRKKQETLGTEQNITVKEFNDRATALRREMRDKRDQILTAEQKQKLANIKEEIEKKKEERFSHHLDKMKTKLSLTDDQVSQIKQNRDKLRNDILKIKNDSKLNDQQKRMKIRALILQQKESRSKMFTSDQLKKIEERKKQKPQKQKEKKVN